MNTYVKYAPNVFVAKCEEQHERGETITMTTKYGKEHDVIVFNLVAQRDGIFFYSVVRADGFNVQEYAKKKAEKLEGSATRAKDKSLEYYNRSNKDSDFLSLGEPIKVGHHSERRHRKIIEQARNNATKSYEFSDKAKEYEARAEYWNSRTDIINESMPESLEYFEFKHAEAVKYHADMKAGKIEKEHSYSLTYAKKAVNETKKKLELCRKLWSAD